MMRGLLERGAEPQHFVRILAGRGLDRKEPRAADRQRAGLVEEHGVRAGERFERPAALDQDAAPRRLRDAGDEGDRRRQDERAGGRGDDHRQRADGIAGEEPGKAGDRDGEGEEEERVAVGEPDEGRLGGLGRRDQADDTGIGALAGGPRRDHLEGFAGIERAAEDRRRFGPLDGHRLAGQGRFVDRGRRPIRRRRRPG